MYMNIIFKSYVLLVLARLLLPLCVSTEQSVCSKVVQLSGNHIWCTGEQIIAPSGGTYILTAAHCAGMGNERGQVTAQLDGEKPLPRKVLDISDDTDLMLLEGIPHRPGLVVSKGLRPFDLYSAYTHGARQATHRAQGELLGASVVEVGGHVITSPADAAQCSGAKYEIKPGGFLGLDQICVLKLSETASTIKVEPGSSGGPVVDHKGQLVGVVSATDGDFSYLVPLKDIQDFLQDY